MGARPASERPATARSLEMTRGSRKDRCGWPLPRNVIISLQFSEGGRGRKKAQKAQKRGTAAGLFFELFAPFCGQSPLFFIAALAFERSLPLPQRSLLAKL